MNKTKILFLSANPKNSSPLRLDEEIREIRIGIERSKNRDLFSINQCLAVRAKDVRRALLDIEPSIVHFSGHGSGVDGLVMEDELGNSKMISSEALKGLFELFEEDISCVILNACFSEIQAQIIVQHIPYVIGMSKEIGDKSAIEFSIGFYDALSAGKSIKTAYKFGCNAIQLSNTNEHLTPILLERTKDTSLKVNAMINANTALIEAIDSRHYYVREIQTTEELEELWKIDKDAYGTASLTLPEFYEWWSSYEQGVKALFYKQEIVGAIGLFPIHFSVAQKIKDGTIREKELIPMDNEQLKECGTRFWYAGGIVLKENYRKSKKYNPIIFMLNVGLNLWMESKHIEFPIEIYSMALSQEGKRMLERFSFIKVREKFSDYDPYPCYVLKAKTKYDLNKILKNRFS